MKKLLLILALVTGFLWTYSTFASSISFGCSGMNCFLAGVRDTGTAIGSTGVITGRGISESVQDFIVYLLSFLSLVAIIYVMYAGAQLLLNPADEESAAKSKKIILGVIGGIVIIWFAWWIVSTIFFLVNNGARKTSWIPQAVAETQIRNVDFTTYSNRIQALKTKIDAGYSPEVISELSMLIDGAYDHLPDRADLYKNKQLYDAVKKAIADYNLNREIIDRGILQSALRNFLEQVTVYTLKSQPEATPRTGDAPLSVTFEAKRTIDESGTVVPNDNYIWWLRTEGGIKRELGRGNIINYTFETSGTYMVFLTVNSASKNSRGFSDVINFEENVVVEVGQPKIQFALRINDQLASKVVKISTKEAIQPIRIDASETRFASGYTTKSTQWEFGNGNTDTNEGDPQFESQTYGPGDYTLNLKLIRNDGEEFSHTVLLKIGDPIASIATTTKTMNKGEKAIFQAKKISTEDNVQYLWEVKKQGVEKILYTFSGTRLEYVFGDTGKYFITLTSIKGDARDKDTIEVDIESRPPNVQFNSEMLSSELPNVYMLDGSNSFDPDYPDNQKLRFEWFINDVAVQLSETNTNNSRGKYTFPEKGTYRVTLRVTDGEGKAKESKRDIRITSILSVKLDMRPAVVKRGARSLLTVTAPQATTYEWKVGSNDPVRTENNRFVTTFPTSGTFPISVTVTNVDGDRNTATQKIYVTEEDQPFSIIDIKSDSALILSQKSICSGQEAITLDRANSVSFSSDRSINRDGIHNDLTYYWKIGLNKTSTQKNVSYNFDELGCEEIALTVSDKITGASHTTKMWVKIVNLPPVFNDIQVIVENLDMDPMKINLKISGAKDPDGLIRSYTWYYYTDRDDQPQGFRITRVPEASFVLPKITGRYYFAVLMEDSNGLKINTKEESDLLFSTPDLYVNTNLSTPIIENFQADTKEVNFGDVTRLSLDVRTPVSTNVADASEYRWDIDGDGFYDVKTTTPFYEFKYVYPGEYNPKVKVTHKGISSTKSLTLVVKNRLVPKANIQMMGTKIIAYNVSTGILQSANWYLDDKKISENKDYLISEIEGSGVHNLKLEISDGKTTESIVYPVQTSLKNKVLLKKITRPLVVLSSLSDSDATEAPEDIVWDDPMTPLYIYLGESRGDIRYFVIDTDITIDTDLSGGKDDDADNKGTASYRSGRPFQIPKGTKRVTIMKIRLIDNNNQDIDTRQIRVTRSFLENTEDDIIEDSLDPKIFNLSQEDKDRIEKLRNLIQSSSDQEKKEFNRILDQLGDNWYDVADRIQTLNLMSNAVNSSQSLPADIKNKILEQISLVYTQGDDQIEEKQLAFKMIKEYLAKSPKKIQIFGDADKPGLINDIIDNPEYYEANLQVIAKIMDDYVDPDTTLSDEVKADIKAKLLILAGSPPAPAVSEIETGESEETNYMTLILWILGGVVCIIFGIVGAVYARQKLTPKNTTPDAAGVTPTSEVSSGISPDIVPAVSATIPGDPSTGTPDWLKEDNSPFGNEDIFSSEDTLVSGDIHQPDWLQDTVKTPADSENTTTEAVDTGMSPNAPEVLIADTAPVSEDTQNIPDWLQDSSSTDDHTGDIESPLSEPIDENTSISGGIPQETQAYGSESEGDTEGLLNDAPQADTGSLDVGTGEDDIPDWLRGADVAADEESSSSVDAVIVSQEEDTLGIVPETPLQDISPSVKLETPENDGKKAKKETIVSASEVAQLHSPENLLGPVEDMLLSAPKKKSPNKKNTLSKQKTVPSDHLLTSEHDMLLSTHTTDTPL